MEEAPLSETIAGNLAAVRGRVEAASRAAGRPEGAVTLVAVSKTHPIDAVRATLCAGQRIFGESAVNVSGSLSEVLAPDVFSFDKCLGSVAGFKILSDPLPIDVVSRDFESELSV